MKTPRININLKNIEENAKLMKERCGRNNINLTGVVKGSAGDIKVAEAFLSGGIKSIGDSRLKNIIKMRENGINAEMVLLRLPRISETKEIVKYVDISLVSEIETIRALGRAAFEAKKEHGILVMIDVGDLREGVLPENLSSFFKEIVDIEGILIKGLGVNVGCYGGVLPTNENTKILIELKEEMERLFNITIPIISGGNTATTILLGSDLPEGINNLRVGEAILQGTDITNQRDIPGLNHNNFTLTASIIELKNKPSVPRGKLGHDAFGNVPDFKDKGIRKRTILAVGRQDVKVDGLSPLKEGIDILGASSDHLLIDLTDNEGNFKIGDELTFSLDYGAMLALMTSDYVAKNYIY